MAENKMHLELSKVRKATSFFFPFSFYKNRSNGQKSKLQAKNTYVLLESKDFLKRFPASTNEK